MQYCSGAFLTMPEMTQYWTKFMDIMVFMLPSDQIAELNEVRETERETANNSMLVCCVWYAFGVIVMLNICNR